MRYVRQINYGDVQEAEEGIARGGASVFHDELRGGETPVRIGKLARGDGAVEDLEALRACLDDETTGKDEGIAYGIDRGFLAGAEPDGPDDIVEAACLRMEVEVAVACGDGLLRGPAGDAEMSFGGDVARVRVVGDLVGTDQVGLRRNGYVAIQREKAA